MMTAHVPPEPVPMDVLFIVIELVLVIPKVNAVAKDEGEAVCCKQ